MKTKHIKHIVLLVAVLVGTFFDAFTGSLILTIYVQMTVFSVLKVSKEVDEAIIEVLKKQDTYNELVDDRLTKLENK